MIREDKTVIFLCPECKRTMMGSTLMNIVRRSWQRDACGNYSVKPIYVCTDCINRDKEVKLEQSKINKMHGGK